MKGNCIPCRLPAEPGAGGAGVHGYPGEGARAVRGLHGRYLGLGTSTAPSLLVFPYIQQPLVAPGPPAGSNALGTEGHRKDWGIPVCSLKLEGSIPTSLSRVLILSAFRDEQGVLWAGSC